MQISGNYSTPNYKNGYTTQRAYKPSFQRVHGLNPLHPKGQAAIDILAGAVEGKPYGHKPNSSTPTVTKSASHSSRSYPYYRPSQEEYARLCKETEAELLEDGMKINSIENFGCPKVVNMDVDGKNYNFHVSGTDKLSIMEQCLGYRNERTGFDQNTIKDQIRNIKDCNRGRFVRIKGEEYFIPYVKNGVPDVKKDSLIIKYGNAETKAGFGNVYKEYAQEAIEKTLGHEINAENLKPIEYITNDPDTYRCTPNIRNDNTVRKKAFGYHDEITNKNCLYFYDSEKVVTNKN